jgi:hypothetical protein
MRAMPLFVALVLLLASASHGSDNKVEVPFLFTEDQAVPLTDLSKSIPPTDVVRTDPYLNAPMTRLEYMLTRMEVALNNETTLAVVTGDLRKRFERSPRPIHGESVRGVVGFSERSGRVHVGYIIQGMGRARSPIREACQQVLMWVDRTLPFEHVGNTLHSSLLGVLGQTDYSAYTPVLGKLASNFVHQVRISSESEEGKVHHTLVCQRTVKDGPIAYDKMSFRLK